MAIIVMSENGKTAFKTTLESARTAADVANKTVIVTSSLTQAQSNITGAWPTDRTLRIDKGGVLNNSTTFTISGPFIAGPYKVFNGAGTIAFSAGSVQSVSPEWWGADPTGSADSTAAFASAIGTARKISCTANASYKIATNIATTTVDVDIEGNGATLDGTASTVQDLIKIGGALGTNAALTTTVVAGVSAIVSDLASDLAEHDLILIDSTDAWSTVVGSKGEMAEVKSVSGTTINLKNPIYDGYTNSTTTIRKVLAKKIRINNLNITRNSNHIALSIYYGRDIDIRNNRITGGRYTCLDMRYIFGGVIDNNYIADGWYTGTGNSYGIMTSSSQFLTISNNRVFDAKHGIAHGGTFPYRDILIAGNTIDNKRGISNYSLDFHSNGEFITVENNKVYNSIVFEGRNITIRNNHIKATDSTYAGIGGYLYDSYSYIEISNNKIYSNYNGIDLKAGTANATINNVFIKDNYVSAKGYGVTYTPYDSTITSHLTVNLQISGNTIYANPDSPSNVSAVNIARNTAKLTFNYVDISKNWLKGSNYTVLISMEPSLGHVDFTGNYITSYQDAAALMYGWDADGSCYTINIESNKFISRASVATGKALTFKVLSVMTLTSNLFEKSISGGYEVSSKLTITPTGNNTISCTGSPVVGTW